MSDENCCCRCGCYMKGYEAYICDECVCPEWGKKLTAADITDEMSEAVLNKLGCYLDKSWSLLTPKEVIAAVLSRPWENPDPDELFKSSIPTELDRPRGGWFFTPEELTKLSEKEDGREIITIAGSIMMGKSTFEELLAGKVKRTPWEVLSEARMLLLMKRNPGLKREEKSELLKKAGYFPKVDRYERLYVYFASSVAPECDAWCYWDDAEFFEEHIDNGPLGSGYPKPEQKVFANSRRIEEPQSTNNAYRLEGPLGSSQQSIGEVLPLKNEPKSSFGIPVPTRKG